MARICNGFGNGLMSNTLLRCTSVMFPFSAVKYSNIALLLWNMDKISLIHYSSWQARDMLKLQGLPHMHSRESDSTLQFPRQGIGTDRYTEQGSDVFSPLWFACYTCRGQLCLVWMWIWSIQNISLEFRALSIENYPVAQTLLSVKPWPVCFNIRVQH